MPASIEYLHELIDRFAAATAANRGTPGRSGSMVQLGAAEAEEVLVAGDLHGQRGRFNKVVRHAALDDHPKRHLVLQEVMHGGPTYDAGGDRSHMLFEDVAALKVKHPDRFHFLLCNHEAAQVIGQRITKGETSQNLIFDMGVDHAYGPAAGRIGQCYRDFVLSCPLAVRLKNGVFLSHTIPDETQLRSFDLKILKRPLTPDDLLAGGGAYPLLWGRDQSAKAVAAFAKGVQSTLLVNGHQHAAGGWQLRHETQLVLDGTADVFVCLHLPLGRPVAAADVPEMLHTLDG